MSAEASSSDAAQANEEETPQMGILQQYHNLQARTSNEGLY